jgi:hypothetical protein
MKFLNLLVVGLLLSIISGCGKSGTRTGQIESEISPQLEPPKFEVVWIDPSVVASDLYMTLIRSDRLDSIPPTPGEIITPAAPAISFDIIDQPCLTTVKMLDARGRVLQPLLMKTLAPGHYKLTVHKPPPAANPNIPYNYSLEAVFCGETKIERITSTWTGRE